MKLEMANFKKCLNCRHWRMLPAETLEDLLLLKGDCIHLGGRTKSIYSCENWEFNVNHVDNFNKQELADIITKTVRLCLEIETSQEYHEYY